MTEVPAEAAAPVLPLPRTVTDELLVAVHNRLGEILDRLPPKQEAPTSVLGRAIEIREPAVTPDPLVSAYEPPPAEYEGATPGRKPPAKKTAARKRS